MTCHHCRQTWRNYVWKEAELRSANIFQGQKEKPEVFMGGCFFSSSSPAVSLFELSQNLSSISLFILKISRL